MPRLITPAAVVFFSVLVPDLALACSCVVNTLPAVGDEPRREAPFRVEDARGVFAIGTVRQIRKLETNAGFNAVVVEIAEPLLNAKAGEVITFLTRTEGADCGYTLFEPGRRYVIESSYYVPAPPSTDPLERKVREELWAGVPAGSQHVGKCGKTQPTNTPEADKALRQIREAIRLFKR